QVETDRDTVSLRLAPYQLDDPGDRIVDGEAFDDGGLLLDEAANARDDLARAVTVLDDALQRVLDLREVRRARPQRPQRGLGIDHRSRDGLVDLVRDRAGQLAQGRCPVGVS